ncbi:uncharacterized protein TANIYAMA4_1443 [Streptococcus canis]|nr:uncharacterized protein TANIYAMA4_1443 [Streptococcus canis]
MMKIAIPKAALKIPCLIMSLRFFKFPIIREITPVTVKAKLRVKKIKVIKWSMTPFVIVSV